MKRTALLPVLSIIAAAPSDAAELEMRHWSVDGVRGIAAYAHAGHGEDPSR